MEYEFGAYIKKRKGTGNSIKQLQMSRFCDIFEVEQEEIVNALDSKDTAYKNLFLEDKFSILLDNFVKRNDDNEVKGVMYEEEKSDGKVELFYVDIDTFVNALNPSDFTFQWYNKIRGDDIQIKLPNWGTIIKELNIMNKVLLFTIDESEATESKSSDCDNLPIQKIYYGAPGTGKSFIINKKIEQLESKQYERVTFFPEYDYHDFVGSILPTLIGTDVYYVYTPGPITRLIKKAIEDSNTEYYLVIEELTRGKTSAIFGDVFQLLDRNKNGDSRYPISNLEMQSYISGEPYYTIDKSKRLIFNDPNSKENSTSTESKVYLPKNLSILATMNTNDQNVYPLDTAFKRRFITEHVSINKNREEINPNLIILGYRWSDLYQSINKYIIETMKLSEDKQVGPFFIQSEEEVEKLLMYLWEDVQKISFVKIFKDTVKTREELLYCDDEELFVPGVVQNLKKALETFLSNSTKKNYANAIKNILDVGAVSDFSKCEDNLKNFSENGKVDTRKELINNIFEKLNTKTAEEKETIQREYLKYTNSEIRDILNEIKDRLLESNDGEVNAEIMSSISNENIDKLKEYHDQISSNLYFKALVYKTSNSLSALFTMIIKR